ncbi:hypothetical protein ACIRBY_32145 [Streptomyces sp. NPDC096136]|uniref:hypothetical protein n=1 Tax=Streptomyces sp. NPDC096136 TaxID=3366076 RepID=UPI0037FDD815
MRERLSGQDVLEHLGLGSDEVLEAVDNSVILHNFRRALFARLVPCIRDVGLWSPAVRDTFAAMGVADAGTAGVQALLHQDEDKAERIDRERRWATEESRRAAEVRQVIRAGEE